MISIARHIAGTQKNDELMSGEKRTNWCTSLKFEFFPMQLQSVDFLPNGSEKYISETAIICRQYYCICGKLKGIIWSILIKQISKIENEYSEINGLHVQNKRPLVIYNKRHHFSSNKE